MQEGVFGHDGLPWATETVSKVAAFDAVLKTGTACTRKTKRAIYLRDKVLLIPGRGRSSNRLEIAMEANQIIKLANFITLKAKPGQAENLAEFLAGGAALVAATEPQTLSWFSVRIDAETFAIIDFFADQAGQDAHVAGQVAAALMAKADELIVGGWEGGVLKGFQVFEVLSAAL